MNSKCTRAGAVLLFASAFAVFAGHELLARLLEGRMLPDGIVMSARVATAAAALLVHGCAGVLLVPIGLMLRRCGMPIDALLICVWTALCAVTCRVAAELGTGVLLSGYPLLGAAATAVLMSIALAPRSSRRPWGVRGRVGADDPMPHLPSVAGRGAFRESA